MGDDQRLYDLASLLLDCVRVELADTAAGAPGRACVVPGPSAAYDDCCEGQVWASIGPFTAGDRFPSGGGRAPVRCFPPLLTVPVTVGVVRCAPAENDDGTMDCEPLDEAARIQAIDALALLRGVVCCLLGGSGEFVVGTTRPVYTGDCVGVELDVVVEVSPCYECAS